MGERQHFHLARPQTVNDGERETAQHETTPTRLNYGPPLGSRGDANQGPLELSQKRFGRIGITLTVPARRPTHFCQSFRVEADAWMKFHPSRI